MSEVGEVHEACARLRFAEGLRRRWPEARAEAAIQEAVSLAFLEGVRIPPDVLRDLVATSSPDTADPAAALAVGIWRAAWDMEKALPPLNSREMPVSRPLPVPAVLAGINRAACTYLAAESLMSARDVAMPANPSALRRVVALTQSDEGTAVERAARAWRLLASEQVFPIASGATGAIFAKWMLARSGVEPTGVAVISRWPAQNRAVYAELVANRGAGEDEWIELLSRGLIAGCASGEEIALAVQAGRYPRLD